MNSKKDNDTRSVLNKAAEKDSIFGDLIFSYSRADAIDDGVLIDVTAVAREAGFIYEVAMTSAAWHDTVRVPPNCPCQDETGRLWDVLNLLRFSIRRDRDQSEIRFVVSVLGEDQRHHDIELKSICGPGDEGEPVITIMLPNED